MKIESRHKLGLYKKGKSFFGEVVLEIEAITGTEEHQVFEKYQRVGFQNQGYLESVPQEGYKPWKEGIKKGIAYGLKMLTGERKFKISILETNGLSTDTNPIILAFVASRAVLNKLDHQESKAELEQLEEIVFSSWDYGLFGQIDFDHFTVEESN